MAQDSTAIPTSSAPHTSLATYIRHNIRDYALLLALIVIMVFFQVATNGILFRPVNITNLVLQNSYVVIMALGMAAGGAVAALLGAENEDLARKITKYQTTLEQGPVMDMVKQVKTMAPLDRVANGTAEQTDALQKTICGNWVAAVQTWSDTSMKKIEDLNEIASKMVQQQYRDHIDLAKLAQFIPVVGAPLGAIVNWRLVERLGHTAVMAYRMRAEQGANAATGTGGNSLSL